MGTVRYIQTDNVGPDPRIAVCPVGPIHYRNHSTTRIFEVSIPNHFHVVTFDINCDTGKLSFSCANFSALEWLEKNNAFKLIREKFYR